MYEILKPNKYTTVVKIPLTDIVKLDVLMAKTSRATMKNTYTSLDPKPDFMINGGLFNMSDGGTISRTHDEGKVIKEGNLSKFGLIINKDDSFNFANDPDSLTMRDFIGGSPSLVVGGKVSMDCLVLGTGFFNSRHPRTAIGMSNTHFFMVSIDGRRWWAKGMPLKELANYMVRLGCKSAINLDGGGSTRLGRKNNAGLLEILNNPTEDRAVDNFVCVYLKPVAYKIMTVTASVLNIRAKPNGAVVGTYKRGTKVEVLEQAGGWSRTSKGWVFSSYLIG